MTKVEHIIDGVKFDHSTVNDDAIFPVYHSTLVEHLSFDEELGFLIIDNQTSADIATARRNALQPVDEQATEPQTSESHAQEKGGEAAAEDDTRLLHLLAFGLPHYVKRGRNGRIVTSRLVHPITHYYDLPESERTVGKQGKGVGFRLYNVPWALRGTAEDPDEVVAYSFVVHQDRLLDLHAKLDAGQLGKLQGIGRHAGRKAKANLYGLRKLGRQTYGDLSGSQLTNLERAVLVPEHLGRIRYIEREGLSELTDDIHASYDQQLGRKADAVVLPQPPRGKQAEWARVVTSVPGIHEELMIVRNSLITLRKEGLYRAKR